MRIHHIALIASDYQTSKRFYTETLGLTGTEQSLLPGLGTGQGLWRIKERSFVVQHQLHPDELSTFDTTTRMIGRQK